MSHGVRLRICTCSSYLFLFDQLLNLCVQLSVCLVSIHLRLHVLCSVLEGSLRVRVLTVLGEWPRPRCRRMARSDFQLQLASEP